MQSVELPTQILTHPEGLFDQLEFSKILEDLKDRCLGDPAKKAIFETDLFADAMTIQIKWSEISEMNEALAAGEKISLGPYQSLDKIFSWLEIQNSVLSLEDTLELKNQILMVDQWLSFFKDEKVSSYPHVSRVVHTADPLPQVLKAIQKIFDEEGNVKDNASTTLKKIRKELHAKTASLTHAFNRAIGKYKTQGYLTDNVESYRNGRRVLSVAAEHKRKIKGIIHDESATGKTVFIEPEDVILINNDLFDLQNEERREINRILLDLANLFRENLGLIVIYHQVIIEFDLIRAKASQAKALGATMPDISIHPGMILHRAYHPLLLLKHGNDRDTVVPFDIELDDTQHFIVISGPNAGGKTITLKAVGLLQLMAQYGLLIPASMDSKVGIFHAFFGDIGDQQSIENDLSTYSSHLRNMKAITEKADRKSLVLIDEFGSGTEPKIGGSIAESILMALHKKGVFGVVTTHYANLKILATRIKGIQNASMEFDQEALRPTYKMDIGVPGSSYAFEMAKRSGLDPNIIQHARKKAGKGEGKLEDLLVQLQEEKRELEQKLYTLTKKEKGLDRLIKTYERMQLDVEVKRKKLRMEEKSFQLQAKSEANKKLEKVIRELREKEKLESAKKLSSKLKTEKKELSRDVQHLQKDIIQQRSTNSVKQKPFQVGDFVRMKLGGMTGVINQIRKGKATILVGNMKMDAPLDALEHSKAPIDVNPIRSVRTRISKNKEAHYKLDIRGLRKEEALIRLEQFIDNALMAHLNYLEIIHGKGNGVLRQALHEKLKDYNHNFNAYHPAPERGGEGLTVVEVVD